MKYPVLHDFIEKFHKGILYKKGEEYPKEGFQADPERVKYLQSDKNPYKKAFLGKEKTEQDKGQEEVENEESSKRSRKSSTKK